MKGQKHFQVDYDRQNIEYKDVGLPSEYPLWTMIGS